MGEINNLMFSRDLKHLVSDYSENKARVWNISTGQCVGIFDYSPCVSLERFLVEDQFFQLELTDGATIVPSLHFARGPGFLQNGASFRSEGLGMSEDGTCITWDNACLLWLPLEYRPTRFGIVRDGVLVGSKLYISSLSGRVLLFDFDLNAISRLVAQG